MLSGAQGGPCVLAAPPFDRTEDGDGEIHGDGDGFVDAIDCDNDDASLVPRLPSPDGYTSPWCEEVKADCYRCPEGSRPSPGVDPAGKGEAPGQVTFAATEGCDGDHGCGFWWTPGSSGLLFVLPLGLGARRSGHGRARRGEPAAGD